MKPAMEYTSFRELKSDIEKELNLVLYCNTARYDGSASLNNLNDSDRWYADRVVYFSIQDNQFSCAIDEIGGFGGSSTKENWAYLFRGLQLVSRRKNQFYRCSVSSQQSDADNIIDALVEVGFTPTGRVKSKHGNYYIYMLEWQKE